MDYIVGEVCGGSVEYYIGARAFFREGVMYHYKIAVLAVIMLLLPSFLYAQFDREKLWAEKYQLKNQFSEEIRRNNFTQLERPNLQTDESIWQTQNPQILSHWECIGPEGGRVSGIVFDPMNSSILYVASSSYPCNIFRTGNAGGFWTQISSLPGYIYSFVIDPNNRGVLYAAGDFGDIYKSELNGFNWQRYQFSIDYDRIYALAVHPKDSQIIYGAGDYLSEEAGTWVMAVFKSVDGGQNWTGSLLNETDNGAGTAVAFHPQNPDTVYIGGTVGRTAPSAKIYKTVDGGSNWIDVSTGITDSYIHCITVHPQDELTTYVGTDNGLYLSTTGGGTAISNVNSTTAWNKITDFSTHSLVIDPLAPDIMYAGSNGEILKSETGGASWSLTDDINTSAIVSHLIMDPCSTQVLYGGTQFGALKTVDGGDNWNPINSGIINAKINHVKVAPSAPHILYASIENDALYKTGDGGLNWDRLQEFEGCGGIIDMAIAPNSPDTLYVMPGGG